MTEPARLWEIGLPALIGAVVALVVTPIVETLKLRLSRKSWAVQERWKLKVSIYERLIVALDTLENVLQPDHTTEPPYYPELTEGGRQAASKAQTDVETATALASLWLPPDLTKALIYIEAIDYYADPSTWREDVYKAVFKARERLFAAAKEDLSL